MAVILFLHAAVVPDGAAIMTHVRSAVLTGVSIAVNQIGRPDTYAPTHFDADRYEQELKSSNNVRPRESGNYETTRSFLGRALTSTADWLDVGEPPREVDDIVLLPGDENYRALVAAALVRAGFGRRILLPTNGASSALSDGKRGPVYELTRAIVEGRGVSSDALVPVPCEAGGTIGDARAAAQVLKLDPARRVAVVTSFYHLRRSRIAFRALLGERADSIVYISAPATCLTASNWWQTEHGTRAIATEFVKLGAYWCWYGTGGYWLFITVGISLFLWKRSRGFRLENAWRRVLRPPGQLPRSQQKVVQSDCRADVIDWTQSSRAMGRAA